MWLKLETLNHFVTVGFLFLNHIYSLYFHVKELRKVVVDIGGFSNHIFFFLLFPIKRMFLFAFLTQSRRALHED